MQSFDFFLNLIKSTVLSLNKWLHNSAYFTIIKALSRYIYGRIVYKLSSLDMRIVLKITVTAENACSYTTTYMIAYKLTTAFNRKINAFGFILFELLQPSWEQ